MTTKSFLILALMIVVGTVLSMLYTAQRYLVEERYQIFYEPMASDGL